MTNTNEHLEHIEHSQHAAHNPFDRNVAMTMAIVAAALACVSLLSHAAHNATLLHQVEASMKTTEWADKWAQYQGNRTRAEIDRGFGGLDQGIAKDPKLSGDAERARQYEDARKYWKKKGDEYSDKLEDLKKEADQLEKEAKDLQEESVHAHHRGARLDIGELFIELALVLCSVAVLTKRGTFWCSGIASCLVGAGIALSALMLH